MDTIIARYERLYDNDIFAESVGQLLAKVLMLRKSGGRYNTMWGTKSNIGLARTVARILLEEQVDDAL